MNTDFTLVLGGEAGQGVESTGAGFALALARAGLHVFAVPDYRSRIRGGHNFFQVRAKNSEFFCHNEDVHLALALTREAADFHVQQLVPGGALVYDTALKVDKSEWPEGVQDFAMPLMEIVQEAGGSKLMANTAAVGAAAGLTGLDLRFVEGVIEDNFGRKRGDKTAELNLVVARAAHDYARDHFAHRFPFKLHAVDAPQRLLISGNPP
jgi:2-oxoglutarate ferredoxin oxidoreductase subunit alpha